MRVMKRAMAWPMRTGKANLSRVAAAPPPSKPSSIPLPNTQLHGGKQCTRARGRVSHARHGCHKTFTRNGVQKVQRELCLREFLCVAGLSEQPNEMGSQSLNFETMGHCPTVPAHSATNVTKILNHSSLIKCIKVHSKPWRCIRGTHFCHDVCDDAIILRALFLEAVCLTKEVLRL
jgi:hypothetical protein